MVAIASQYGCPQRSCAVSHITSDFPHHEIICPTNTLRWYNLLKISLAVKKGAALFKVASVKKVVKSKEVAKKWLWWYRLMAKILIITIQVNMHYLIPASLGIRSTYTIMAADKHALWELLVYVCSMRAVDVCSMRAVDVCSMRAVIISFIWAFIVCSMRAVDVWACEGCPCVPFESRTWWKLRMK